MNACPNCGSTNTQRYRNPQVVEDVVLRRHRCLECRHIFLTAQVVVSGELARQIVQEHLDV